MRNITTTTAVSIFNCAALGAFSNNTCGLRKTESGNELLNDGILIILVFKAPRKLIDSGCNSSAEQVAMGELEKLLVANPRYTECNWLIRPRQMGKQANYPVVRLANGIQPRIVFKQQ